MDRTPKTTAKRRAGQAGFSLIEVLVAIALLVVGIVAIISLFPPGFQAMDNAQTRTAVRQTGANELNRAQSELGEIALIYSEYNGNTDDLTWNVNVGTASDYANGGINSERLVSGETFAIPPQNQLAGGATKSTYMTTFGPIVVPNGDPSGMLSVRGTPWQPVQGTYAASVSPAYNPPMLPQYNPNVALTHDQPQYLVDYQNGQLALPLENYYYRQNLTTAGQALPTLTNGTVTPVVAYPQVVNFSVWALDPSTSTYQHFSTQFTYDPTNTFFVVQSPSATAGTGGDGLYHSEWFDPTKIPSLTWTNVTTGVPLASTSVPGAPWANATASLSRDYNYVGGISSFTNDPFEWALDGVRPELGGSVNPGALHFPVEASAMRDAQNNPVNAMVDYTVVDWHILREDVVADSDNLRLEVPAVLGYGDQMELGAPYDGLLTGTGLPMGAAPADFFVYDTGAGNVVPPSDYSLSYNTGRLNLGAGYANSNAKLRVYYRARHQWGFGVTKAAATYTYNSTIPTAQANVALATYYTDSALTKLYFPFTDNGKSVSLSGVKLVDGMSHVVIAHGGTWTILETTTGSGVKLGYIDLTQSRVSDGNPPGVIPGGYTLDTSGGAPVATITGTSSMVRAIYYEQNAIRHEDITSYSNP